MGEKFNINQNSEAMEAEKRKKIREKMLQNEALPKTDDLTEPTRETTTEKKFKRQKVSYRRERKNNQALRYKKIK